MLFTQHSNLQLLHRCNYIDLCTLQHIHVLGTHFSIVVWAVHLTQGFEKGSLKFIVNCITDVFQINFVKAIAIATYMILLHRWYT